MRWGGGGLLLSFLIPLWDVTVRAPGLSRKTCPLPSRIVSLSNIIRQEVTFDCTLRCGMPAMPVVLTLRIPHRAAKECHGIFDAGLERCLAGLVSVFRDS